MSGQSKARHREGRKRINTCEVAAFKADAAPAAYTRTQHCSLLFAVYVEFSSSVVRFIMGAFKNPSLFSPRSRWWSEHLISIFLGNSRSSADYRRLFTPIDWNIFPFCMLGTGEPERVSTQFRIVTFVFTIGEVTNVSFPRLEATNCFHPLSTLPVSRERHTQVAAYLGHSWQPTFPTLFLGERGLWLTEKQCCLCCVTEKWANQTAAGIDTSDICPSWINDRLARSTYIAVALSLSLSLFPVFLRPLLPCFRSLFFAVPLHRLPWLELE